jgi:hypothetical protein
MPPFAGAQSVTKIYKGTMQIARAYGGATLVFDHAASENLHLADTSNAESVNRNAKLSDANDG